MIRSTLNRLAFGIGLVTLSLAASSPGARAAAGGLLSPSIFGGLNQTVSSGGSTGFTAGGRLSFGLGMASFDVGAGFLRRSFGSGSGINYIQIPAMLRFSLAPALSFGGGFYLDPPLNSGNSTIYGLRGALQFKLPGIPLFLEGSYSHNLGEGGAGNVKDLQLLVGFSL